MEKPDWGQVAEEFGEQEIQKYNFKPRGRGGHVTYSGGRDEPLREEDLKCTCPRTVECPNHPGEEVKVCVSNSANNKGRRYHKCEGKNLVSIVNSVTGDMEEVEQNCDYTKFWCGDISCDCPPAICADHGVLNMRKCGQGQNEGKTFHACPGKGCKGFGFKWCSDWRITAHLGPASRPARGRGRANQFSGGGSLRGAGARATYGMAPSRGRGRGSGPSAGFEYGQIRPHQGVREDAEVFKKARTKKVYQETDDGGDETVPPGKPTAWDDAQVFQSEQQDVFAPGGPSHKTKKHVQEDEFEPKPRKKYVQEEDTDTEPIPRKKKYEEADTEPIPRKKKYVEEDATNEPKPRKKKHAEDEAPQRKRKSKEPEESVTADIEFEDMTADAESGEWTVPT